MRTIALLFGFYILCLATLPGINLIAGNISEINCCEDKCEPGEEQGHEENLSGESCNPFQSCSCCTLGPAEGLNNDVNEVILLSAYTHCNESVPPDNVIDFWQPPKV